MKKYLLAMLFLSMAAFCISTIEGNEPSNGPEIELTFMNTTEKEVRILVREEVTQNPFYTYETVLFIKLAPGEAVATPVTLAATDETIRQLFITAKTGDKKYEKGGSLNVLELDIAKSNQFGVKLWEGVMPKLSNWHYMRIVATLLKE
jgi:hypothetical protein